MTHQTTQTSLNAYKNLDASSLYSLIRSYLRKISPGSVCIADIAKDLGLERSTVSARFNEMKNYGELEYAGKKPSKTTGITAQHWRIKNQETLF